MSLKIERAGASPGKARLVPAAETFGSQRGPDGETLDLKDKIAFLNHNLAATELELPDYAFLLKAYSEVNKY